MTKKNKPIRTKEERRESWDYAIGMAKIDGGEPTQEFLCLAEQEINGDIPEGETLKRTIAKWKELGAKSGYEPEPSQSDPYVDAKTGVLINKLGIYDRKLLQQAETEISAARMEELQRGPI